MNKKIEAYLTGIGLTVEGNNAYGTYKGYEISANYAALDTVAPLKFHVNLYAEEQRKITFLNELKALKLKFFTYDADIYGITLGFNDALSAGRLVNRLPEMLDKIFAIFTKYEALGVGYCPVCGEPLEENAKKYQIEWAKITIDAKCVKGLNEVIEAENKEFEEAPNNYIKGTIGALLGALVGVIAFIILFFLGYVSALTSFVAILLGAYFYKKFGGKQNVVMVVILSVVSIGSMLLAMFGMYVLAAEVLAYEAGYGTTGITAFNDMMLNDEFKSEFIGNMLLTLLYTVLGVVFQIIQLAKSIKRQGNIN